MKLLGLWLVTFSLMGCVTESSSNDEYEAYLNTFIGKSRKALVAKWGAPNRRFDVEDDGSEIILVYIEDHGVVAINNTRAESLVCKTEFTLVNGKVKGWSYDGDC